MASLTTGKYPLNQVLCWTRGVRLQLDRARLLSVTANDEVAFWSGRDGPVV